MVNLLLLALTSFTAQQSTMTVVSFYTTGDSAYLVPECLAVSHFCMFSSDLEEIH